MSVAWTFLLLKRIWLDKFNFRMKSDPWQQDPQVIKIEDAHNTKTEENKQHYSWGHAKDGNTDKWIKVQPIKDNIKDSIS